MSQLVDLVTATRALGGASGPLLEIVRLDANDTAIIPFMSEGLRVDLHYCQEPDLGPGYVYCNLEAEGDRCLLCEIGRKRDGRYLLPVYLPLARTVGILPISPTQTPRALLPQILNHLQRSQPVVLFIRREGGNFTVISSPLKPGVDDGAEVIDKFKQRFELAEIRLEDAFVRIPNSRLASIPEVAQGLALRGKTL